VNHVASRTIHMRRFILEDRTLNITYIIDSSALYIVRYSEQEHDVSSIGSATILRWRYLLSWVRQEKLIPIA
jgi:hypothetical protein